MKRTVAKAIKAITAVTLVAIMTLGAAAGAASQSHSFLINPKADSSGITMVWDDAYLDGPTTVYNADLAKFCMDAASADVADAEGLGRDEHIAGVYEALGFDVVEQVYYNKSKTDPSHTTSFTVAKRAAKANGKDVTVYLVAVHPNGIGEVMSDFDFAAGVSGGEKDYDTAHAYPFTKSAEVVFNAVNSSVGENKNVRFVIAGESRGGGAANYLAKLLTDQYGPHLVQAYTYSTPNTAIIPDDDVESSYYNNIFNIINPEDAVTYVPVEQWGFSKYGRTLQIDADWLAYDFYDMVAGIYAKYTGYEVRSNKGFVSYEDNGEAVQELIEYLYELAPAIEDYYTTKHQAFDEYTFVSYGSFGGDVRKSGTIKELPAYEFIRYVFGLIDVFSAMDTSDINALAGQILVLRAQLASVANYDYGPLLEAILYHVFGCEDIDELLGLVGLNAKSYLNLLSSVGNLIREYGTDFDKMLAGMGEKIPLKEGYAAHVLYGYRAYLEAAMEEGLEPDDIWLNSEILTDGETDSIAAANDSAILRGERAFYDDMKLTLTLTEGSDQSEIWADYSLALSVKTSRGENTALEPNGPVTVYLKLSESLVSGKDLTLVRSQTGENVDFTIEDGYAVFEADTLEEFRISASKPQTEIISAENDGERVTVKVAVNESAANRIIVAGYTSKGRMTGLKTWIAAPDAVESVSIDSFLPTTAYFKLFITTEDYSEPLAPVKTFPVSAK